MSKTSYAFMAIFVLTSHDSTRRLPNTMKAKAHEKEKMEKGEGSDVNTASANPQSHKFLERPH